MQHEISLGEISAVIDEHGGRLCSFKVAAKEYLWDGDDYERRRASTNIFPFYGALTALAQKQLNMRESMGRYGIIADVDLFVEEKGQDYISLCFRSNETTKKSYPFDFLYKVEFRIIGMRLAVSYEVQNHSERDMFFACAGSVCVSLPLGAENTRDVYDVEFLYDSSPELIELSKDGYNIGTSPYKLLYGHKLRLDEKFPVNEDILLNGLPPRISILSPKGGNIFRLRSQGMNYTQFNLGQQNGQGNMLVTVSTTQPPKDKKTKISEMDDIIKLPKNESFFIECSFTVEQ